MYQATKWTAEEPCDRPCRDHRARARDAHPRRQGHARRPGRPRAAPSSTRRRSPCWPASASTDRCGCRRSRRRSSSTSRRSAVRCRTSSRPGGSSASPTRTTAGRRCSSSPRPGARCSRPATSSGGTRCARILAGWTQDEQAALAGQLARFNQAVSSFRKTCQSNDDTAGVRVSSTQAIVPEGKSGALSHKQIMTILAGLLLGMFLAALDQTIVATAMRTIADRLNGLTAQAWVTTAYLITSTVTTPLYGKLSDMYGRKPFYMFAIIGLRRRLHALRHRPLHLRARCLPRPAGRRCRWPDVAGLRHRRRHRATARTWSLPGLLHGRLRVVQRPRTGPRRLPRRPVHHPRHRRLALDLLHQRADRHRRPGRGLPGAQPPAHPLQGAGSTTGAQFC